MIGHYVDNLTRREEDRLLLGELRPLSVDCVLGRAEGWRWVDGSVTRENALWPGARLICWRLGYGVGHRFDDLCRRFGTARIANATRNRILTNRARRALQSSGLASCDLGEPVSVSE